MSFSADGSDTFGYHGSNRMTSEITFFGVPLYSSIPVPGETTLEIRMSDFLVPNKDTQYACQAFAMPVDQVNIRSYYFKIFIIILFLI